MGSEQVKGSATKTNWKRHCSSQALPLTSYFPYFLRKSGRMYFTENFGDTIIIIYKNLVESTTVCSLRSLRSLALNKLYISAILD